MKHLSDKPTCQSPQVCQRRADSLQVSFIDASTSGDALRLHETHFNGENAAAV